MNIVMHDIESDVANEIEFINSLGERCVVF